MGALAYYNEWDSYAADWLRNLAAAGHIAPGIMQDPDPQADSSFYPASGDRWGKVPTPSRATAYLRLHDAGQIVHALDDVRFQAHELHDTLRKRAEHWDYGNKNGEADCQAASSPLYAPDIRPRPSVDVCGIHERIERRSRVGKPQSISICCSTLSRLGMMLRIVCNYATGQVFDSRFSSSIGPYSAMSNTFGSRMNLEARCRTRRNVVAGCPWIAPSLYGAS